MRYNFKTLQKKEHGKWITKAVEAGGAVPFMLIDDLAAKFIYKQKLSKITKDCNGITVYYSKTVRAVYSETGSEII